MQELCDRVSPAEFTEWQAFFQLEPFGAWRDNYHAAMLSALTFNIHRGKATAAAKVSDFMYEDPEITAERQAKTFVAALNARVKHAD